MILSKIHGASAKVLSKRKIISVTRNKKKIKNKLQSKQKLTSLAHQLINIYFILRYLQCIYIYILLLSHLINLPDQAEIHWFLMSISYPGKKKKSFHLDNCHVQGCKLLKDFWFRFSSRIRKTKKTNKDDWIEEKSDFQKRQIEKRNNFPIQKLSRKISIEFSSSEIVILSSLLESFYTENSQSQKHVLQPCIVFILDEILEQCVFWRSVRLQSIHKEHRNVKTFSSSFDKGVTRQYIRHFSVMICVEVKSNWNWNGFSNRQAFLF